MRTIGSLFSGVGGLELGLEVALGADVVWQVETSDFCRAVLEKHWPLADRSVVDVRDAGRATLDHVDIICGGFPCQDLSQAGRGEGLMGSKSGLWYEMLRVVDELRPSWVVIENVASGARRWLREVRCDLHLLGYDTAALELAASDVGAPHLRRRVFVVAHPYREGELRPSLSKLAQSWRGSGHRDRPAVEARLERSLGGAVDGFSTRLDRHLWPSARGAAPHRGEVQRTVPWRTENMSAPRRAALGNAVVPQCALAVGRWLRATRRFYQRL